MIKEFFSTFEYFPNFGFLKTCYDALLSTYNKISMFFRTTKSSNTFFNSSSKEDKHACTTGCGLAGCSYGEKHKTSSYQKARNLFCADTFFQPKKSFSYGSVQDGVNIKKVRV
jgi:hypothetical protein